LHCRFLGFRGGFIARLEGWLVLERIFDLGYIIETDEDGFFTLLVPFLR
jgi:hypothetical protein